MPMIEVGPTSVWAGSITDDTEVVPPQSFSFSYSYSFSRPTPFLLPRVGPTSVWAGSIPDDTEVVPPGSKPSPGLGNSDPRSGNEADAERVAVGEAVGGLDRRDNRQNKRCNREYRQQNEPHKNNAQGGDAQRVEQQREVEVKHLLGLYRHRAAFGFFDQIHHQRENKSHAQKSREVAENDEGLFVAVYARISRGV